MPEFVEPKQLVQTLVLVKRARLTARRSAARPNRKSKATSESAQEGRQVSRKANKEVATGAINMGAGPGSRVAFEADDSHVGGNPSRNPASELRRICETFKP